MLQGHMVTTHIENAGILGFSICRHIASHGESNCADIHVLLIDETERHRHIVHDPASTQQTSTTNMAKYERNEFCFHSIMLHIGMHHCIAVA